jgi:hypothetical protein
MPLSGAIEAMSLQSLLNLEASAQFGGSASGIRRRTTARLLYDDLS